MGKHKTNHPCSNCGLGDRSIEDIRNNNYSNYFCSLGKEYECDKKKQYDEERKIKYMTDEERARLREHDIFALKELLNPIAAREGYTKEGYSIEGLITRAAEALRKTSPCELCKFDPTNKSDNNPCLKCPAEARYNS